MFSPHGFCAGLKFKACLEIAFNFEVLESNQRLIYQNQMKALKHLEFR